MESEISPYWKGIPMDEIKEEISSIGIDSLAQTRQSLELSSPKKVKDSWYVKGKTLNPSKINHKEVSWEKPISKYLESWKQVKASNKGSKKIRIYPSPYQKKILNVMLGDSRLNYNAAVNFLKNEKEIVKKTLVRDAIVSMKSTVVTNQKILDTMERTPNKARAKAVFDACVAHNNGVNLKSTITAEFKKAEKDVEKEEKHIQKLKNKRESISKKKEGTKAWKKLYDELELLEKRSKNLDYLNEVLEHTPKFARKNFKLRYRKKKNLYSYIGVEKENASFEDIKKEAFRGLLKKDIEEETLRLGLKKKLTRLEVLNIMDKRIGGNIPKEKSNIKNIFIFKEFIPGGIICGEGFDIDSDFMIRKNNRLDNWEIIISRDTKSYDFKNPTGKMITFDPGFRTFLTGVDCKGDVTEYAPGWSYGSNIKNRKKRCDLAKEKSQSYFKDEIGILHKKKGRDRIESVKSRKKWRLHNNKLHNMVYDMHKKVAKELVESYDVIVLPKMGISSIIKRDGKLTPDQRRNALLLAHCKFHDYVSYKAKREGKIVINVNESYTTKTCYKCGLMTDIGTSKIFECNHCGNVCDRDVHSCLNILTKFLS